MDSLSHEKSTISIQWDYFLIVQFYFIISRLDVNPDVVSSSLT